MVDLRLVVVVVRLRVAVDLRFLPAMFAVIEQPDLITRSAFFCASALVWPLATAAVTYTVAARFTSALVARPAQ